MSMYDLFKKRILASDFDWADARYVKFLASQTEMDKEVNDMTLRVTCAYCETVYPQYSGSCPKCGGPEGYAEPVFPDWPGNVPDSLTEVCSGNGYTSEGINLSKQVSDVSFILTRVNDYDFHRVELADYDHARCMYSYTFDDLSDGEYFIQVHLSLFGENLPEVVTGEMTGPTIIHEGNSLTAQIGASEILMLT